MMTLIASRPVSFFPYLLVRVLPIAAIVMVIVGLIGLLITQTIAENKADELLTRQSKQTKTIIELRLNNILAQTKILSKNALLVNGLIDLEGRNKYLPAYFRNLQLAGYPTAKIEITDYKGRALFRNRSNNTFRLKSDTWRKSVVESASSWALLGGNGLAVIHPILYLNNAEGAVIVSLDYSGLPRLFDVGVQLNETVVVDGKEQVIFSSNNDFAMIGKPFSDNPFFRKVATPLDGFPGIKIFTLQKESVALATQQWMQFFLVGGILIALLTLVGAVGLTAYIAKREVSHLSNVVKKVQGTIDMGQRVKLSGPSELHTLGEDFNQMLEVLRRTTTSFEYVDSIISNTTEGIITIDTSGTIETFNNAAEVIFGYKPDEVLGYNVSILMPREEAAQHDRYLKKSDIYASRIINLTRDLNGRRKDGSMFPLELNVAPMKVGGSDKFIGIIRDITERKKIDKMKGEFISTVSHELRTPLTSIKGSLGIIQSGTLGKLEEKQQALLEIAYKNSDRLVLLINDLLDMEKISAGKMEYQMKPIEIGLLVHDAITANEGFGNEYDVKFVCSGANQPILINGDKDRLMQVMANLMSNAAKFSPPGANVEINISHTQNMACIAVSDNGPGVKEEFREKIFDKFSQADSSDTRQKGGTGLGLSITKEIVEQHGGLIELKTQTGEGATFTVNLPIIPDRRKSPHINISEKPTFNNSPVTASS